MEPAESSIEYAARQLAYWREQYRLLGPTHTCVAHCEYWYERLEELKQKESKMENLPNGLYFIMDGNVFPVHEGIIPKPMYQKIVATMRAQKSAALSSPSETADSAHH